MELKHNTESIYPKLPSAPVEDEGQSYRLQRINEIHKILEGEKERASLSKKYHRAVNIVDGIDVALIGTTMGLGIGGLVLLSTIVVAPIVIVMEGVALGTGALSIVGKYVNKKFSAKAEKHERIKTLAVSKLNTITSYISKALVDNKISDEEFQLILSELDKYRELKEEVRRKSKKRMDYELQQSLIEQGRQEARESIRKLFEKNNSDQTMKTTMKTTM